MAGWFYPYGSLGLPERLRGFAQRPKLARKRRLGVAEVAQRERLRPGSPPQNCIQVLGLYRQRNSWRTLKAVGVAGSMSAMVKSGSRTSPRVSSCF